MSDNGSGGVPEVKRMRLRYAGRCRTCAEALPAGTTADYSATTKTVQCLTCASSGAGARTDGPPDTAPAAAPSSDAASSEPTEAPPWSAVTTGALINSGAAGASARREYERRSRQREERVRAAHPKIGGFLLAISDEPRSTTAWAVGARGEELLGRQLDGLGAQGVLMLHDRRIPRTRANIDHIAVTPSGVYVIDAKRYKGRPTKVSTGGLFSPRVAHLLVGGRNQDKLVDGALHQVDLVRAALDAAGMESVPVQGMLCFVEADWPLIGGSFQIRGVDVLWPKKATEHLTAAGPLQATEIDAIAVTLAAAFPAA